jgi:hypothetical protein
MSDSGTLAAFQVPLLTHWLSGCVERLTPWWVRLGNLESATLREQLDAIPIVCPVYVAGIARAGTTIVLELLSRHPEVATHKYRDFPGQFIPVWWNRGQRGQAAPLSERAHGDRLQVSVDSPEAMEETLWMAFFADLHRPEVSCVLDRSTSNLRFEQFYQDHLKKLLLVRERSRYVAKGNYNLTRFGYLQKLFPDARFVVVVRNPRDQIVSLIRQQRLFSAGESDYPRALAHMRRVGHFEFGLDRRAICVGDGKAAEVMQLWQQGEEVRGLARSWASIYGWLAEQLAADETLQAATRVLRYEDLCAEPAGEVEALLSHCQLAPTEEISDFARQIAAPSYYAPELTSQDEQIIAEETAAVAERMGYAPVCEIS